MCGLAGLFGPPHPDKTEMVQGMIDALAHRGPDGGGIFADGPVVLGHRRLAIIGPGSVGDQPARDPQTGTTLVFNGAIYNYPELADGLDLPADHPDRRSDTKILLALLARMEEGPAALAALQQRLQGMWAFAAWQPQRQQLVLARDRFGVKPLFYCHWRDQIAFASEIAALMTLPGLSRAVDRDSALAFLTERMQADSSRTRFTQIRTLAPGHQITFTDPSQPVPEPQRWFSPRALVAPARAGEGDEDLKTHLADALALRLRADTPPAFLLSGGLDSATLLALAVERAQSQGTPLPVAYSLAPDQTSGGHADGALDYDLAQKTAAHLGIDLRPVPVSGTSDRPADLPARLTAITRRLCEPLPDGSMLAHDNLMAAIQADGYRLVIGGLGGDEALAGYVPELARALAADQLRRGALFAAHRTMGSWSAVARALPHALPTGARNTLRLRRHRQSLAAILAPDALVALPERERVPPVHPKRTTAALREGLERLFLPGFLHYEDHNAMAHGIETRAPFLDPAVVGFGMSVDPTRLLDQGLGKQPLRRLARTLLPDAVAANPRKIGLPAPADQWLSADPDFVTTTLTAGAARLGLFETIGLSERIATLHPDLRRRVFGLCLWAESWEVTAP
ncbi:MAG: asparagine synthase (glutamine-hydrolyzing) [Rhodospirillaceae bacterium]